MRNGFSAEEQMILYGVTSGIPEYLSRIYINRSMDKNIIELFFEESGRVFGDICQQYLYHPQIYTKLPFLPGNTGRWWGTDPVKKRQEEIDIMAIQDNQALLCECKWRNVPVNIEITKQLLDRGKLFHYDQIFYFLFSKTGFTKEVLEYQKQDSSLFLISFDKICLLK